MSNDEQTTELKARILQLETELTQALRLLRERPKSADPMYTGYSILPWGTRVKTLLKKYRKNNESKQSTPEPRTTSSS